MKAKHHLFELAIVNLAILVFVEVGYKLLPLFLFNPFLAADCSAHRLLEHFDWYLTVVQEIFIEVEEIKGIAEVEVRDHDTNLLCLIYELLVLDVAISVLVHPDYYFPQVVFKG